MSERRYDLGVRRTRHDGPGLENIEALRSALQARLEQAILLGTRAESVVRAFSTEFVEVIEVDGVEFPERDGRITEIVRHVLGRREILRAFREGVVEGQDGRHLVALFELEADGAWWLAWRWYREVGDRLSPFDGEWETAHSSDEARLPNELRSWIDIGSFALTEMSYAEEVEVEAEILAATLRLTAPIPDTIEAIAEFVGELFDAEFLEHGVSGVVVMGMRGRDAERWELTGGGALPCSLDDFVRSVSAQMHASAVVVIHEVLVEEGDRTLRGFCYAVEYEGQRFERILALRRDARGRPIGVLRHSEMVDQPLDWLGIEPVHNVEIIPDYPGFWQYMPEVIEA